MRSLFALVLAATAVPALAQTSPAAPTAPAAPVEEKMICRKGVPTGSIMLAKLVCHTKAEWEAISRAQGENAYRARNSTGSAQLYGPTSD